MCTTAGWSLVARQEDNSVSFASWPSSAAPASPVLEDQLGTCVLGWRSAPVPGPEAKTQGRASTAAWQSARTPGSASKHYLWLLVVASLCLTFSTALDLQASAKFIDVVMPGNCSKNACSLHREGRRVGKQKVVALLPFCCKRTEMQEINGCAQGHIGNLQQSQALNPDILHPSSVP